jgi:hypothetical protein
MIPFVFRQSLIFGSRESSLLQASLIRYRLALVGISDESDGWIGGKSVPGGACRKAHSPQLHNSAARHRLREFARKSKDPCLTTKVVNATIS